MRKLADLRFAELICRSPTLDIRICIFSYLGHMSIGVRNLCHRIDKLNSMWDCWPGNRSLTAIVYIHITVGHTQPGQHLFGKLYYLIILSTFSWHPPLPPLETAVQTVKNLLHFNQLGMSRENTACFLPLGPISRYFGFSLSESFELPLITYRTNSHCPLLQMGAC